MKKKERPPLRRLYLWLILLAALAAVSALSGLLSRRQQVPAEAPPRAPAYQQDAVLSPLDDCSLGGGLSIVRAVDWTGPFVEDGSHGERANVFALLLQNASEQTIQYAEIHVSCGGRIYEFPFSTLPPGETLLVQESAGQTIPADLSQASAELPVFVCFPREPDLCPEIFDLFVDGAAVTVKNKSGSPVSGDIYVYYKNYSDHRFLGGITYRTKIGGLAAGESVTLRPGHFSDGTGRLMFVTYVP